MLEGLAGQGSTWEKGFRGQQEKGQERGMSHDRIETLYEVPLRQRDNRKRTRKGEGEKMGSKSMRELLLLSTKTNQKRQIDGVITEITKLKNLGGDPLYGLDRRRRILESQ